MTKFASVLIRTVVAGLLMTGDCLYAQPDSSADSSSKANVSPAPGGRWRMHRFYNPDTVETLSGKVTNVERIAHGHWGAGVHITLQTRSGEIPVHLGPSWYLDKQDVQIKQGDRVQVTGSRVEIQDQPVIVAAKVVKGDQTLTLRDSSGFPAWAGGRGRGQGRGAMPQGGMRPGMGHGMMGRGMMGQGMMSKSPSTSAELAADDPGSLLAHRKQLNLTTAQVRKLQAIQADARARANAVLNEKQQKELEK